MTSNFDIPGCKLMSRFLVLFKSCKQNHAEKNAAAARDTLREVSGCIFHIFRSILTPTDTSSTRKGICKKVYPPTNAAQNAGNL